MERGHLIENCKPPYIDVEALRRVAEETWPEWKINFYNLNVATTAHARKLRKKKMLTILLSKDIFYGKIGVRIRAMAGIIYKLTNSHNGKVYIGMTTRSLLQRLNQHHYDCRHGSDRVLYRAMRKYGEDSFTAEIIDQADTIEELKQKEQYWIQKYDSYAANGRGYNATLGGDTSTKETVGYTQISLYDGSIINKFSSAIECNDLLAPCTTLRADKIVETTQYIDYVVVKTANIESLTQDEIKDYAFSLRPKIICLLDKDGKLIKRWINSSDILKAHPDYNKSCIFACLWGKRKTHKGYLWKYYKDIGGNKS